MRLGAPHDTAARLHHGIGAALPRLAIALAASSLLVTVISGAASAATRSGTLRASSALNYVSLGDSYTAGPLIPDLTGSPAGCARSSRGRSSLGRGRVGDGRAGGAAALIQSCAEAFYEPVEDLQHFGSRLRAVRGLSDVQCGFVPGSHEHMRERQHWLGGDASQFDRLRQEDSHQPEDVQIADLPPVRPAQDGRPVDEGDAENFRFDADIEPRTGRVLQGLDGIRNPGCRHVIGKAPGDIGLDGRYDRLEQRGLIRELVIQRPPGNSGRRDDGVGRHLRESLRGEQATPGRHECITSRS